MLMLRVNNISVRYGAISALYNLSIEVNSDEVVALVGSNGAGKTTLLESIAGVLRPHQGEIEFEEQSILGRAPEDIVRLGISLVPEGRRIFASLSVYENLRLGAIARRDSAEIARDIDRMCERFSILGRRLHQPAGAFSGGEQQQLAIARALMARPRLLMLDEPSLGLAPLLVEGIFEMIDSLRYTGVTILLVEQNVERTLAIADRAYLLNTGRIESSGTAEEIREQVDIESAYLGLDEE
jgi:branched-chain amino acid transport system ATP-binding protein